jgi:hypothetical protein
MIQATRLETDGLTGFLTLVSERLVGGAAAGAVPAPLPCRLTSLKARCDGAN